MFRVYERLHVPLLYLWFIAYIFGVCRVNAYEQAISSSSSSPATSPSSLPSPVSSFGSGLDEAIVLAARQLLKGWATVDIHTKPGIAESKTDLGHWEEEQHDREGQGSLSKVSLPAAMVAEYGAYCLDG